MRKEGRGQRPPLCRKWKSMCATRTSSWATRSKGSRAGPMREDCEALRPNVEGGQPHPGQSDCSRDPGHRDT
eukprot:13442052-Heterocapsa_arctica.AAC.1